MYTDDYGWAVQMEGDGLGDFQILNNVITDASGGIRVDGTNNTVQGNVIALKADTALGGIRVAAGGGNTLTRNGVAGPLLASGGSAASAMASSSWATAGTPSPRSRWPALPPASWSAAPTTRCTATSSPTTSPGSVWARPASAMSLTFNGFVGNTANGANFSPSDVNGDIVSASASSAEFVSLDSTSADFMKLDPASNFLDQGSPDGVSRTSTGLDMGFVESGNSEVVDWRRF